MDAVNLGPHHWTYDCYKTGGCCDLSCKKKNGKYVECDAAKLKSCSNRIPGPPAFPGAPKPEGAVCSCEGANLPNLSKFEILDSKKISSLDIFNEEMSKQTIIASLQSSNSKGIVAALSLGVYDYEAAVSALNSLIEPVNSDETEIQEYNNSINITTPSSTRSKERYIICKKDCLDKANRNNHKTDCPPETPPKSFIPNPGPIPERIRPGECKCGSQQGYFDFCIDALQSYCANSNPPCDIDTYIKEAENCYRQTLDKWGEEFEKSLRCKGVVEEYNKCIQGCKNATRGRWRQYEDEIKEEERQRTINEDLFDPLEELRRRIGGVKLE